MPFQTSERKKKEIYQKLISEYYSPAWFFKEYELVIWESVMKFSIDPRGATELSSNPNSTLTVFCFHLSMHL